MYIFIFEKLAYPLPYRSATILLLNLCMIFFLHFQYDSFVKFIDHQIQRRFNESQAPSYLS